MRNRFYSAFQTPACSAELIGLGLGIALVALVLMWSGGVFLSEWGDTLGLLYDDGIYWMGAESLTAGNGYVMEGIANLDAIAKYPPLFSVFLAGVQCFATIIGLSESGCAYGFNVFFTLPAIVGCDVLNKFAPSPDVNFPVVTLGNPLINGLTDLTCFVFAIDLANAFVYLDESWSYKLSSIASSVIEKARAIVS